MNTKNRVLRLSGFFAAFFLTIGLVASSACVVVKAPPAKGDISLGWVLEGDLACSTAGVDSVIVSIRNQDNGELFEATLACTDAGATFNDFLSANYNVHVDAVDDAGQIFYAGAASLRVEGGRVNDLGVLVLYDTNPIPPTASLSLDWSFYYPADEAILDCAKAGADYVNVYITDVMGSPVFNQNIRCLDGPAIIDDLNPGDYSVELQAFGDYRGQAAMLYTSELINFSLTAGQMLDLGTMAMDRNESQFADISIDWSFDGNPSCQYAGVEEVWFRTVRLAIDEDGNDYEIIDDEETVNCEDGPLQRNTFVPGDYYLLVDGMDANGATTWNGSLDFSLAPNSQVDLLVETQTLP